MAYEDVLFEQVRSQINTVRDLADYLNLDSEYLGIVDKVLGANGWERPVNHPETVAVDVCRNECVTAAEVGYTVCKWIPKVCGKVEREGYCLEAGEISEKDCQLLTKNWEYRFGEDYKALYDNAAKTARWYGDKPSDIYRLALDAEWRNWTDKVYVAKCRGTLTERTIEAFFRD